MEFTPEVITLLQMIVFLTVAVLVIRILFSNGKKIISGILSLIVSIYIVIQYGLPLINLL